MKIKYRVFCFTLAMIALFLNTPLSTATPLAHPQLKNTSLENKILIYINKYRLQHHLPALIMNEHLVTEARKHSQDMAAHIIAFGHAYFYKRLNTLRALIKHSSAASENVAYNYKDAQDVVKNWLRSPGHKKNIDGDYNLTGIGIAYDKQGKIYFTQIFLRTEKF